MQLQTSDPDQTLDINLEKRLPALLLPDGPAPDQKALMANSGIACCCRLVFSVFAENTERSIGTACSQPIRVLANNDVPGGAPHLDIVIPCTDGWSGWGFNAAPSALSLGRVHVFDRDRNGTRPPTPTTPEASSNRRPCVYPFLRPLAGQMHLNDLDARWWAQNPDTPTSMRRDHGASSDEESEHSHMPPQGRENGKASSI